MSKEDDAQRARSITAQAFEAAKRDAIENWSPQFVGAIQGLTDEIRQQRLVTERLIADLGEHRYSFGRVVDVLERLNTTCSALTDELEALRSTRSQNGHDHGLAHEGNQ